MAGKDDQTIIIKKIKKGGGGHHGGAWKVAYADFVTAMMAFFLLLWLLATASEEQKEGLAEYFTPTIGLKDSQGIGFEGGSSKTSQEGTSKNDTSTVNLIQKQPDAGEIVNEEKQSPIDGDEESEMFEDAKQEMMQAIEADPNLREFTENIRMEQTPEGLKITLNDTDKHSMFNPASTDLSDEGKKILKALTPLIRKLPNHLSITGHTDAMGYSNTNKQYSNWELSADRANSARRYLEANQMTRERVKKIVGFASEQLIFPDDPANPGNRRIELILLRGSHMSLLPQSSPAPRSLLTVPSGAEALKERQHKIEEESKGAHLAEPPALNGDTPMDPLSVGTPHQDTDSPPNSEEGVIGEPKVIEAH